MHPPADVISPCVLPARHRSRFDRENRTRLLLDPSAGSFPAPSSSLGLPDELVDLALVLASDIGTAREAAADIAMDVDNDGG